ncbi:thyrotropin receptor-like [Nematostella vectensis]|uniref:thyrotropin receptor-like n=1 Tax=Nematostella vectensis TaxID=45351 RepID=UPI0020775835|nr:thyrotropin receptor-like [Nematostella vectensis]
MASRMQTVLWFALFCMASNLPCKGELPTSQKYENDDRTSDCSATKELDVKMITGCCIQNLSIFQEKAVDLVKVLCLDFSSKGLRKIPSATMPNLRYLNISRNPDIKLSQINFITQLPNVSILDLTGNPHWPNVSQISTLRMLNLIRGTPLDDKCLRCYLVKNLRNIDTFLPKAVKRELDTAVEHPVKFNTSCYGNILEFKDKSFVLFENIGFKLKCVNLDKRCFQGHADIPFFKGYASVGPLNSCWSTMNNISSPIFAFASIALILNLVVVMVTFRSKTVRQNTAQLLVGVVAVGDLLMGVYLLLITSTRRSVSYEHMTRLQRSHFCYFVGFVSIFGQGISAFSSFIVTIERYLAVVFCLQPDIRLFTPIAHGFIAVIFFLSFVFAILPFTVLKGIYVPDSHCTPVSEPTSEVIEYMMIPGGLAFILYFLTFPLYVHMYLYVTKSSQAMGIQREGKVARRIALIVFSNMAFFFLPIVLLLLVNLSDLGKLMTDVEKDIFWKTFSYICFAVNACLNPVLFAFRNEKFRNALRQQLHLTNRVQPISCGSSNTSKATSKHMQP